MNGNLSHRILQQFVESQLKNNCESIADHPLGLSLFNQEKNLHFVMVPKNASTSISIAALTSTTDKWIPSNWVDHPNSRYIIVLRDPIERFISAANMFLTTGKNLFDKLPLISNNRILTNDCHFQPQCKFISNLSLDNIDFFWYNNNVVQDIEKFYNLSFNQLNLNVGNKLIKQVDNELIKKLYKDDYELINSVKFVNMP